MDWIVGGITILAMELISRHRWEGWLVGLLNQVLWGFLIYQRSLWGFIPLWIILIWRYSAALLRWRREAKLLKASVTNV